MVDVMIVPRMPDPIPPPEFMPVQRLRQDAQLPARAHPWDAGLDLIAVEAVHLEPGARGIVPTGIAVAIPVGWAGLVVPRSGLARRQGITLTNSPCSPELIYGMGGYCVPEYDPVGLKIERLVERDIVGHARTLLERAAMMCTARARRASKGELRG